MRNGVIRFLGGLFGRSAAASRAEKRSGDQGTLADLLGERGPIGAAVTSQTALGLPAVTACVRLLGDMVSALPLALYQRTPSGPRLCADHPAHYVVNFPGELHHSFGLRSLVMTGVLLGGNGYVRVHRGALGQPEELEWLSPLHVRVERLRGHRFLSYRIEGESAVYSSRDILHVRALSTDGVRGLSPVRLLRESIGTAISQREKAALLMDRRMGFEGVLEMPPEATPEQVAQMREFWTRRHQGLGNAGVVPILQGAAFKAIGGMSAADSEFLENRRFELQEIARLYGVPGFLIGDTTASTSWGSGIEQQNLGFLRYSLNPWLINFEQALGGCLLTREEQRRGYHFVFDREELEGAWLPAQASFVTSMRNAGIFSVNDAREWLGYARVGALGADDYQIVPVGGGQFESPSPSTAPSPPAAG